MFLNDQTCLRFDKCAKLLGVNLDESLNFDTQVNEVVSNRYFHAVSEREGSALSLPARECCWAGRSSIQASYRSIGKGLMTSVPTLPFVMCFATSLECAGAGVLLGRPIADQSLLPLYREGLDDVGADFAFCHGTRDGGRLKGLRSAPSASFSQSSSRITRWQEPNRPRGNLLEARPHENNWQLRLPENQLQPPVESKNHTDTVLVPLPLEKFEDIKNQLNF